MNLELIGKTALISGSTKGIGFAIASQLAAEGTQVIVNGRSDDAVAAALQQIRRDATEAKVEGFAATCPQMLQLKVSSSFFPKWTSSSTTSEFTSPSHSIKFPTRIGAGSLRSMCSVAYGS